MHDSIPARRRRRAAYQHSRVGEAILSTAEDVRSNLSWDDLLGLPRDRIVPPP
jgi:hypothetical protein